MHDPKIQKALGELRYILQDYVTQCEDRRLWGGPTIAVVNPINEKTAREWIKRLSPDPEPEPHPFINTVKGMLRSGNLRYYVTPYNDIFLVEPSNPLWNHACIADEAWLKDFKLVVTNV